MVFLFKRLLMCLVLQAKWQVKSYNLGEEVPKFDNILNESLDPIVSALSHNFPNCVSEEWRGFCLGQVLEYNGVMWGHLFGELIPVGFCYELPNSMLLIAAIIVFQDRGHYGI